jgi:hypothetical protein
VVSLSPSPKNSRPSHMEMEALLDEPEVVRLKYFDAVLSTWMKENVTLSSLIEDEQDVVSQKKKRRKIRSSKKEKTKLEGLDRSYPEGSDESRIEAILRNSKRSTNDKRESRGMPFQSPSSDDIIEKSERKSAFPEFSTASFVKSAPSKANAKAFFSGTRNASFPHGEFGEKEIVLGARRVTKEKPSDDGHEMRHSALD